MRKVSPVTGTGEYPGQGWVITSKFDDPDYFARFNAWHTGHDLSGESVLGKLVYAAADGEVRFAEFAGHDGFGNLIFIRHQPDLFTRYAHLQDIYVQSGQFVTAGGVIGTVGNTGRSTGPHLHFDVMRMSNALDWPKLDRERLRREYIDPHDWYAKDEAITSPLPNGVSGEYRVTAEYGLNIRMKPGVTSGILRTSPFSDILHLADERTQGPRHTWRRVVDGGWVAEEFVELVTRPVLQNNAG